MLTFPQQVRAARQYARRRIRTDHLAYEDLYAFGDPGECFTLVKRSLQARTQRAFEQLGLDPSLFAAALTGHVKQEARHADPYLFGPPMAYDEWVKLDAAFRSEGGALLPAYWPFRTQDQRWSW